MRSLWDKLCDNMPGEHFGYLHLGIDINDHVANGRGDSRFHGARYHKSKISLYVALGAT